MQLRPRARRTRICGIRGEVVVIEVNAPPVEGAANQALLATLAEALKLPRSALELARGSTSRQKLVAIPEAAEERLRQWLAELDDLQA